MNGTFLCHCIRLGGSGGAGPEGAGLARARRHGASPPDTALARSHPASRHWVAAGCDPGRRAQLGAAVRGRHRNADALQPGSEQVWGRGRGGDGPWMQPPGVGRGGTEEVREESTSTSPPPSRVTTHRVLWPGAAMGSGPGSALTSTPCSFIAAFQLEFSQASAPSHLFQQWLNTAHLPWCGTESPSSTTQETPWEETRASGPQPHPRNGHPHTQGHHNIAEDSWDSSTAAKSSSPGTRTPLRSSTRGCAPPVPAPSPRCCQGHAGMAASTAPEDNSPLRLEMQLGKGRGRQTPLAVGIPRGLAEADGAT